MSPEIREIKCERVLNPTGIDLGDFVINPYRGCAFGCLFCYVRFNKNTLKESRPWGSYVDVRLHMPDLLEKEILQKKPEKVLLGSTTECFQSAEKKYGLTRKILEILQKRGVRYTLLTRSPDILDVEDILKKGGCNAVYFTVNGYSDSYKQKFEPLTPSFDRRFEVIAKLKESGIPVIPYFCPLMPFISDYKGFMKKSNGFERIELEALNFNLGNIQAILSAIAEVDSQLEKNYRKMMQEEDYYSEVWRNIQDELTQLAQQGKTNHHIFVHRFQSWFENSYQTGTL